MSLKSFLFIFSGCLLIPTLNRAATHIDSVGIEEVNGKLFVIHKVEPKETLYGLSRRYGASVEDIITYNPEVRTGLIVEKIVKVPYVKSVAVKTETEGKPVESITHTVEQGQTVYAISKKYGVSTDDIKKWNNLSSNDLSPGQVLIVGTKKGAVAENTKQERKEAKKDIKTSIHIVESGQTLGSVAAMYGITESDIRRLNNLNSDNLTKGQQLLVNGEKQKKDKKKGDSNLEETTAREKDYTVVEKPDTGVQQLAKPRNDYSALVDPFQEETADAFSPVSKENMAQKKNEFKKIVENGLAEVIEETTETSKFLALHRTAPIGTIMQVQNEMNNITVFVRVVGKLPDTGTNDKLVIKLSRKAYETLGAIDKRFPVIVSFIP